MFKVSQIALNNVKMAYLSTLIFSINPASNFFNSIYTESSFCFYTLCSFLYFFKV